MGDASSASAGASSAVVGLTNFVYPAWCDPEALAGTRLDYAGTLSAPFQVGHNGYVISVTGGAAPVNRFGAMMPDWLREAKGKARRVLSRAGR